MKKFNSGISLKEGNSRRSDYLKYQWSVLLVTTVGILMAGIDSRIILVGLPIVASSLGADVEQAIWFTQAYTLGSTVILLLIGRITDLFGRVKIYNLGFVVFTIGSALASISQNPTELIAFRIVQGVGAGVIFTNSVALITDATPENGLGFALGLNNLAFRFGAMAGLTLSGVILSFFDWRAMFYVNVPIGIFGTVWAHRQLKEFAPTKRKTRMDWMGFAAFTVSITSFLLAITYAAYGISQEWTVYGLLILSGMTIILFIIHERRHNDPLLDLDLLKIREYFGGIVAQLINAIAWGAVLLLLALYFELVQGLDVLSTGLRLIPFELSFLIIGPLSGKLSDRLGHLPFTTSGLAVTSLSLLLFSTVGISTPYWYVVVCLILFGVGIGLFSSPNMSSIMGSVPAKTRGVASALRSTFFNVGFTISLNLAVLIMTFKVPYGLVSRIVSSVGTVTVSASDRVLFAEGLKNTYIWLALINSVAIVPSVLRSKKLKNSLHKSNNSES
jgi:EmrB/QacA subfamily drug resistance transporter